MILEKFTETLSGLLNFGLKNIPEPWIFRMDSDDIWMKGRYISQINFLKKHPDAWAIGGALRVTDTLKHLEYTLYENHPLEITKNTLLDGCLLPNPTTLIDRKKTLGIGGYNELFIAAEDYELWSRMVFYGKIYRQKEELVHYKIHRNSQSISKSAIQNIEADHIKFNIIVKSLNLPICKLSHVVGSSPYCHFLVKCANLSKNFRVKHKFPS